ncbi:restriction endonuclease subunit S [Rudanella paleaurantiibacter]|uniref:restriction endonuclease subunit S n=1 Tax=Rudanella paleaurantiibacter TaxID=2614655 RepID=UPI001624979F|nr:restriction endonuclease subunit S [Rudanella paleaurantiibacter]
MVAEPIQTTLSIDKSGWKKIKLGDVVREVRETAKDPVAEGLERVIGLEHLEPESLHIKAWGSIANATTFTKKFRKGQMLFGRRRAYLKKAALATFDGICSGDITVLEAKSGLLPELLPFLIQNDKFFELAIKNSAGSLSPRAKFNDFADYEFLLPPKDQQEQIAELLWAGDEALQSSNTALCSLNEVRLAVRRNAVCDKAHQRVPLSEILQGITAGRSLNGVNTPAENGNKGVLKVSAVGPNGFEPLENKLLDNGEEFLPRFKVNKDDLLITRANTTELVGRVCLVEDDYPNLMLCDKTLRLDIKVQKASKLFLLEALLSLETRAQIEGVATGTGGAMKNISQPEIMALKIPLPDYNTQLTIAEKIASVIENRKAIIENITQLSRLQKSLINQFF